MNKKKRLLTLTITVIVLALVFLSLLFIRLKPGIITGPGNNELQDSYTKVNVENIKTPEIDGPMIPTKVRDIEDSNSNIRETNNIVEIKEKEANFLGGSVLQEEQVIVVTENGFSPRTINVIHNAKVPLVLKATDDKEHEITLQLEESQVKLPFSKGSELVYNFVGPEPGDYEFYIDDTDNKGVMRSVSR
jgi:hypothetical protein